MALRFDPPLVTHLARELDELLAGARLRAVRLNGRSRDLVLLLRERSLVWHLHPTRGDLALAPPAEPGPGDARLPARIRRVAAPPDERIVRFELLPRRSGRGRHDVVVELLGNQWNAVVVESATGTIRHVLVRREKGRALHVGGSYAPPAPSDRAGRDGRLAPGRWPRSLAIDPGAEESRALVARVAWTSPINARALLEDAAGDPPELWRRLADPEAAPEPVVLQTDRGPQPYPFPLPGAPASPAPSLLEAFRVAAPAPAGTAGGTSVLAPATEAALERAADGARRRVMALLANADRAEDPDALRAVGDLLLARFSRVAAGRREVELVGFDGAPVRVALDPALPVQANAEAYYERASKAERARARLPGLLAAARREADRIDALARRVRAGTPTEDDLAALAALTPPDPTAGDAPSAALPYRRYRSSGGLEIRVGRGARHNDDLTFRHSAPNDVWLHVGQAAGAHVVLRWSRDEPPPARDLEEAAVLAALHSKARTSSGASVSWTRRKYVRKPRGSAPGSVVPERVRTLWVTPDPQIEARLAERAGW